MRAAHKAKIWVGNLDKAVSNELLYRAFESFGQVARAIVACLNGKSQGWGFVEFYEKKSALDAVDRCLVEAFMLTRSGPPVKVEKWCNVDIDDGLPEEAVRRS